MVFFKNEKVTIFLEKFFDSKQRLIQNLLFWGEESVGKMTTARKFSETLLCSNRDGWEACEKCDSCKMIEKGCHPDLMIIEPDGDNVKIEQIRQGLGFLLYYPQISSLKILIIDKADRMTEDSQNALLKTLEEPRDNNLIILVAAAPKKLLATVRSRLLPLRFTKIADVKIVNFLQKEYSLSLQKSREIAERADGKIGKVIKLLEGNYQKELDRKREDLIEILNQNFARQSLYFQKLAENEEDTARTLEEWLRMLRSDKDAARLKLIPAKRTKLMADILRAVYLIKDTNINKQLLMENIFLQL